MQSTITPQSRSRSAQHRSKPSFNLNIVYRRIDELKPDPANPLRHSKKQIRQIANSIKAFGFNAPILIERDGNIIAGHGRWLACRLLGWSEVPTLCLDHLSPAQARAFMIADNRLAEIADWDDRLLAQQLKELSEIVLDFNIEDTGFEIGEIDLRIMALDAQPPRPDDPADVLPGATAGPPVSSIGDLWLLGGHRLLCGSALECAAFAALMGEERAAMVFTDRPITCRSTVTSAAAARSGRNRSNVWQYPGANCFARRGEEGNLLALHPTVKPVAMVADAILDCTARGVIVLDAFLGSGTTVIAAERTGLRSYGLELDGLYVDTIIRRWQALTGGKARHAASDRSFDDLACEAEAANAQ